tara:strand:+ start:335 stop:550 length:216 start_codon:yes stop_codon:yes gene_type:complete
MTIKLNKMLIQSRLKVVLGLSWAKTAALKPMHKIVIKNTNDILRNMGISFIRVSITAADPRQLWPIIAIAA